MDINEVGLYKLTQWAYDTDYDQFVDDMKFEDFTEDYCYEKFKYMQDNFAGWIGGLSKQYLKNLAVAINSKGSKYEEDN